MSGVRIANPAYGPTAPPERLDGNRASWSRWDTTGTTLYIASNKETAFRECLAWTRMTGTRQKHLTKLAALFNEAPKHIMVDIDEDWKHVGPMQPGHLPMAWRDGHLLYTISAPADAGWWIDTHAQETLVAHTRLTAPS